MVRSFPKLADAVLESTVVGSFTRLGPTIRRQLFDWDQPSQDLTGMRVLLTGGTSGIGEATAIGLVELGADVIITSRSAERAAAAADRISENGPGSAAGIALDTASFPSVLAAARAAVGGGPIDVLIHNAGALSDTYGTNEDDVELTVASHLIGPYLLTKELLPSLRPGARVLWMSSGGMYTQRLDVERLVMDQDSYRGAIAYARAKRAQVELVSLLGPRWAPDVVMHAMHPGWVDTPGVSEGLPGFGAVMGPLLRDPASGADTMIWLAATGGGEAAPGSFWLDRRPRATTYLPGTSVDDETRQELVDWLEMMILPATVAA